MNLDELNHMLFGITQCVFYCSLMIIICTVSVYALCCLIKEFKRI